MRFQSLTYRYGRHQVHSDLGTVFGSENGVPAYGENCRGERRSDERVGERQKIRFYVVGSDVAHHGTLINGSGGGAWIETNDTLPLLTLIRIEGAGISSEAKVCRVHWLRPDERTQKSGGMAVRLVVSQALARTEPPSAELSALPLGAALGTS